MIKHEGIKLQNEKSGGRSDLYGFASRSDHLWWRFAHPTAQTRTATSEYYSAALIRRDNELESRRTLKDGATRGFEQLSLPYNWLWRDKTEEEEKTNKPGTPWGPRRARSSLCHAKCMPRILNQWQRSSASSPWQPEFSPWVTVDFSPLTLWSKNASDLPNETSLNRSNPPPQLSTSLHKCCLPIANNNLASSHSYPSNGDDLIHITTFIKTKSMLESSC